MKQILDNKAGRVYIKFRTRLLERCRLSIKAGEAEWGRAVARKYLQRIDVLKAIQQVADLRSFPSLHYHPLKGERKGQYAISLTKRMRLIFTLEGDGFRIIRVEEVSKHYGD